MLTRYAALALSPALLLAACGDYEDASAEAQADTVEIPANEPLSTVTASPVADPNANTNVAVDEPVVPADGATDTTGASPTPGATGTAAATGTPGPTASNSPAASPTPTTTPAR
jgi:hypothetical protein